MTASTGSRAWLILGVLVAAAATARADDLFLPVDSPAATIPGGPESAPAAAGAAPTFGPVAPILRQRLARIDRGLLDRVRVAAASGTAGAGLLDLNLFDDARFRVTDLATAPSSAGFAITGDLEGVPHGTVAIVVNGEQIAGSVRTPTAWYQVRRAEGGHVVIRQIDESALPEGAEPLEPPPGAGGPPPAAPPPGAAPLASLSPGFGRPAARGVAADVPFVPSPQTQAAEIDVLVVYTPFALLREGGIAEMDTTIDLWFTEVNKMFADSGARVSIRPALVAEVVGYEEGGGTLDLSRLVLPRDGHMDEVHALRDAVGADVVHLVEGEASYCGIAYVMKVVEPSFADLAFGATNVICGSRTFAHELGHNLGLQHDRYQRNLERLSDFENLPHVHSYGYTNHRLLRDAAAPASASWYTIMAYSTMCLHMNASGCGRAAYFSTPDLVTAAGDPLGVPATADSSLITGPADAVTTINLTAPVVAAFRGPPTAAPAVAWVRRTTEDDAYGFGPGPWGYTLTDTLGWRVAFTKDVRNVSAADFVLTGSGFGAPTLTVTARGSSQRAYDVVASGGALADFDGEVGLGFASGQDIEDLSGTALPSTWPAAAELTYTVDNSAPVPTISPTTADALPIHLTVTWNEPVRWLTPAASTVSSDIGFTWHEPTSDTVFTATVDVLNFANIITVPLKITIPSGGAADRLLQLNEETTGWIDLERHFVDPNLSVTGFTDDWVEENAVWTSANPSLGGSPVGTISWSLEARDSGFSIDTATGVVTLAPRDFENALDGDGDNVYEATVIGADSNGDFASGSFAVTVRNVTETRSFEIAGFSPRKLPERRALRLRPELEGSWVVRGGARVVEDGPVGDVTWSLFGPDASHFTWSAGKLEFAAKDFENPVSADGDNDYQVSLTGTDEDGNSVTEGMIVRIVDALPRPLELLSPSSATVNENAAWTGGAPRFQGRPLGATTVTKSGADAALFRLDSLKNLSLPAQDFEAPGDADRDNVYEVTVRLADEEGNFAEKAITVTVADVNETPQKPSVTLGAQPSSIREGATSTVTATLSSTLSQSVTIPLTVGGTARSADFTLSSSITIPANTLSASVSLSAQTDTDTTASETVTVALDTGNLPSAVRAGSPASVTVTILDGTPKVNLKVSPNPVTEGSSATVTVELTRSWGSSLTFALVTAPTGSAPAGPSDYTAVGSITVNAGRTSATGSLATTEDADRDDETLRVALPSVLPSGVVAGIDSSVTVTIADRTPQPQKPSVSLGVSPSSVAEGSSTFVTARLSATLSSAVTMPLTATRDTAEAGDFDNPSPITISAGSRSGTTPLVTRVDSDRDDEVFTVALGALPSEVRRGSPSSARVTITDTTPAPGPPPGPPPGPAPGPPPGPPGPGPGPPPGPPGPPPPGGGGGGPPPPGPPAPPPGPPPPGPPPPGPPPPPPPPGPPPPPPPPPPTPPPSGPPQATFLVDVVCPEELCRVLTGQPVRFADTSTGGVTLRRWHLGDGRTSRSANPTVRWAAPGFYDVTLVVSGAGQESVASRTFLVEAAEPLGTCEADASTRCLGQTRFAVDVTWRTAHGASGGGTVVPAGTDDSALFRFFDGSNWEVLVKVLDGCEHNGHVWVFAAATTDLGYEIRVADTAADAGQPEKTYSNEPGSPAAAVTDLTAFPDACAR